MVPGVKPRVDDVGNAPRSLERLRSSEPLQRAHVTAGVRPKILVYKLCRISLIFQRALLARKSVLLKRFGIDSA